MRPLLDLLAGYQPFDELEAAHVAQLRQFLLESPNPYDRSNLVAHVVADAWIVNPARSHVVLVEHAASGAWMAPGGHCDGSPDLLATARREAEEEVGLAALQPLRGGGLFDLNVGYVPTRRKGAGLEPTHLHFDVCLAFEAPDNAPLKISPESTALAWVPVAALPAGFHPDHARRPAKTLAGWLA